MKYSKTGESKTHEFESIQDFLNYLYSNKPNRFFQRSSCLSQYRGNKDWYGTDTFDEAVNLLRDGWAPKAEKLTTKLNLSKKATQQTKKARPVYGVMGSAVSVPRYLQGIPTNMVHTKLEPVNHRVVTITKDVSYNSIWTSEDMECEGLKVLQIIDALQRQGLRVKLNVAVSTTTFGESLYCKICVKQPQDALSVIRVAFPMGHPSMLRRLLLRWVEVHDTAERDFSYNYGSPGSLDNVLQKDEYYIPIHLENVEKFAKNIVYYSK